MAHYQTDAVMLDLLKKVQELQIEIVATGRTAHLDASTHETLFSYGETHISFDMTVFEEHQIVESFEFDATDDDNELEYEFRRLSLYVDKVKKAAQ